MIPIEPSPRGKLIGIVNEHPSWGEFIATVFIYGIPFAFIVAFLVTFTF